MVKVFTLLQMELKEKFRYKIEIFSASTDAILLIFPSIAILLFGNLEISGIQSKTEYLSLYQKLGDYMTTNMTADEMEELTEYKIAEDTVKIPGEIIEKDGHAQYLVDNKELKKIILKMFYKTM